MNQNPSFKFHDQEKCFIATSSFIANLNPTITRLGVLRLANSICKKYPKVVFDLNLKMDFDIDIEVGRVVLEIFFWRFGSRNCGIQAMNRD